MTYLFLGERRSARAIRMGVTWRDGNLSARPLFNALAWHGIDPRQQRFENLFIDGDGPLPRNRAAAFLLRPDAQRLILDALSEGCRIVAMGNRVADHLRRLGVEHIKIRHPGAIGAMRRTDLYTAHIGEQLKPL